MGKPSPPGSRADSTPIAVVLLIVLMSISALVMYAFSYGYEAGCKAQYVPLARKAN